MEEQDLLRRADDLSRRCAKKWEITETGFLTPAERLLLETRFRPDGSVSMLFFGGYEDCERSVAFFLPEGEEPEQIHSALRVVHYRAYFREPGHRDYLGALLASGVSRDRIGDILIDGADAAVFCLPGILGHLLTIERIGRVSVKAEELPLSVVRPPKRETKEVRFTVMSPRVDAVASGMFHLSRTACVRLIEEGLLSLNYSVCTKTYAPVREGDIISLRGHGKGVVSELGGSSRKGRLFVIAEIYA
ncbi:MAG: hypothetical protein IKX52_00275 [Clostridia bacterium]|nr:hypothetical protein [Clostridia bacterium]